MNLAVCVKTDRHNVIFVVNNARSTGYEVNHITFAYDAA